MNEIKHIPALIRQIYEIVDKLEAQFPDRHFTPDGHLVGRIGEVLAAYHYDLELLPASTQTHDARAQDGCLVQIKATQRSMIGIRSEPEHLLVLRILPNGESEEVYNGPGQLAWNQAGKMQKNGQRTISVTKLMKLMGKVPLTSRLPKIN